MEFVYILVISLGVAVAEISLIMGNPWPTYLWCGVILPASLFLSTIYFMRTGKLPKNRMKIWAVIVCGAMVMSFSGILTLTQPTIGIILLLAGLLIIISTALIFKHRKP